MTGLGITVSNFNNMALKYPKLRVLTFQIIKLIILEKAPLLAIKAAKYQQLLLTDAVVDQSG